MPIITITINYHRTGNNVDTEKICYFSLVILFIVQNIEITKLFLKKTALFKKITTIFVMHVHKSFVY